jgi:hypothetical protein
MFHINQSDTQTPLILRGISPEPGFNLRRFLSCLTLQDQSS